MISGVFPIFMKKKDVGEAVLSRTELVREGVTWVEKEERFEVGSVLQKQGEYVNVTFHFSSLYPY